MALLLAQLELAFLFLLTLVLLLQPAIPVPPRWGLAAAALTTVQTAAVHNMRLQGLDPAHENDGLVDSVAEAFGLLVVPALTAALIAVVLYHLADAYAFAYRRLQLSIAQAEQARRDGLGHRQRHADGLRGSGGGGRLHHGQLDR